MKRLFGRAVLVVAAVTFFQLSSVAQSKFEGSVGVDLVSKYVWRGQDLGGVSIQPSVSIGWNGLSLSAWGSTGFSALDTKEFDLTLGYSIAGFSVSITDYWFNGGDGYFKYASENQNHTFEAQVGYDFGFLSINWWTNFAGNVGMTPDGKKAYASYFSISAPFQFVGLDWEATVGATPWNSDFYGGGSSEFAKNFTGGFAVCEVGISASKEIKITEEWSLPIFGQIVWNPSNSDVFFVAGISF